MLKTVTSLLLWTLLSCLLLARSPLTAAAGADCVVTSEPPDATANSAAISNSGDEDLPLCSDLYPVELYQSDPSPWRIGFGGGYGTRSNPLLNSDDIPIYGVIQLSYFGERFFFDNGDFGVFLSEGKSWSLNGIAGIGGERSFYSFLNSGSIGFAPTASDGLSDPEQAPLEAEPRPSAPDRDMTVDGGLEWLQTLGQVELQVQLLTDISGKHNGQEAWVSLALPMRNKRWEWVPSLGVNYKSAKAANYYFGVSEDEAEPGLPAYEADAAASPFVRMTLKYQIDQHWKLVSVLSYEHLTDAITDSPAVEDDHIHTAFAGLYYEF